MNGLTRQLRRLFHRRPRPVQSRRLPLPAETGRQREIDQARNLLALASHERRADYPAGYQSIDIHGVRLRGRRDPAARLALTGYDFTGKRVIDVGSNRGGMLHVFDGRLRWGIGLEIDPLGVNAANRIAAIRGDPTVRFYVFDADRDQLDTVCDLMPDAQADVTFLLSVCMWIARWKELVTFCAGLAPAMFFEANGSDAEQAAQIAHLKATFATVVRLSGESGDDPFQKRRQSFWCENPIPSSTPGRERPSDAPSDG